MNEIVRNTMKKGNSLYAFCSQLGLSARNEMQKNRIE